MNSSRHIPSSVLLDWVSTVFTTVGMPPDQAALAAHMLVQTSLWGIDSHGVARVPHYLSRISAGSIAVRPQLEFRRTAAGTGQVDGGHGLGFVVCEFAMRQAIALAQEAGVGAVGVGNSSHCGAIGLYTRQATRAGMIGIAFTHSDSFVVPHGGDRAFFGTNPISIAIPGTDPEQPFCVDMATSITPWNRIMNARREGRAVPLGLGVDETGADTTDPERIRAVKPMAEHKGYALAFAIDMLCGPLNAMAYGPHLTPMYEQLGSQRRLGSFVLAIDPVRFAGGAMLAGVLMAAIREAKAQKEGVLAPGDPEYRTAAERTRSGIPIDAGLWEEFLTWSGRLQIPAPASSTS
jgi:ureidoglycolate dehydrogenase (NAD+)